MSEPGRNWKRSSAVIHVERNIPPMKHKAILITMVSVAAVCAAAAGVLLFNPSLVTNLVARTYATQSATEPATQPPTQAPTKSSLTALEIENVKM